MRKRFSLKLRDGRVLQLGERTQVVGVLNVTPDSFSDGGQNFDPERAVRRALEMENDGADIVEVGGESTRPGSGRLSPDEELARVVPVLEALGKRLRVPIAIDTYKSTVARVAFDLGASLVNDVSALRFDAALAGEAARAEAALVLMHMRGEPATMQKIKPSSDIFTAGQPVKLVFTNPDATDHNLVIVNSSPDSLAEVGMAANEMARDPRNANSDFVPATKKHLILHASPMIGPTRKSQIHVFRFRAPTEPGIYPYVCTFPGHWVVMNGEMIVAKDLADVPAMLATRQPAFIKAWTMTDFPEIHSRTDEMTLTKGMQAFVKARCNQCHVVARTRDQLGQILWNR